MKKIILIVIVLGLIIAYFVISNKKKKDAQEQTRSGNYVGVNTPGGEYGVDLDQVSSGWETISGIFGGGGGSNSSNSDKTPVNCEGLTPEERNAILNSDNYTCA